jgi:excinuclease ABC subunit C
MTQTLLFPDPRPLVERLGREFFQRLPQSPGVYLMRDGGGTALYVGKAKNLKRRLGSYRVANPDRLPRRHLRLLRAVQRIDIEACADETAALAREAELLRALRPKFNRAGTWPPPPRFMAWRWTGTRLELDVVAVAEDGGRSIGPLGRGAFHARAALARLLWRALHPQRGMAALPHGWAGGRFGERAAVECETMAPAAAALVKQLFALQAEAFCLWVRARVGEGLHPLDSAMIESDLETVAEVFSPAEV